MKIGIGRQSVICMLLVFANIAQAASWRQIGANSDTTVSIDDTSVKFNGAYGKAWFLLELTTPETIKETYPNKIASSMKELNLYDCAQGTTAIAQQVWYASSSGQGETVRSWSQVSSRVAYNDVVPDSLGETMLREACKRSGRK